MNALAGVASTTPAAQTFADSFFSNLFARITVWLADATNGVGKLFAGEVHTKELCVTKSDGTDVCLTGDQLAALMAGQSTGGSSGNTSTSTPDTAPPVVTILGNNPATVHVGDTYADLGATVTDNVDQNLGIHNFVNGVEVQDVTLNTSTSTAYTITYKATDAAGNVGQATRTVNVIAP